MAKRRLSKRQLTRIRDKQCKDDEAILQSGVPSHLDAEQTGFIIAHFGTQVLVQSTTNAVLRQRALLPANVPPLVVGDNVRWQSGDELGAVSSRMPRKNVLERPDHRGLPRAVAANIDQLFIVIAPSPPCYANLIDRYLVAASYHNMDAAIILNKVDLDSPELLRSQQLIERYIGLGYRCLPVSVKTGQGFDALTQAMHGHTAMLAGQSGVGKSSITNLLIPEADTAIGALSHAADKGRHTTTASHWYGLNESTSLIDSPGIREFSLNHLTPADILRGFIEIAPIAERCKFNDCSHQNTKGCAVEAALNDGIIEPERLHNYFHLVSECEPLK